jgi:hypothetical protein
MVDLQTENALSACIDLFIVLSINWFLSYLAISTRVLFLNIE